MMKSKKCVFKFGHYTLNPKDAEAQEVILPEDTLFFTGGDSDIGSMKHTGAYHALGITKATNEELEQIKCFGCDIVKHCIGNYEYLPFRINGWAFVSFHNCIPVENVEFTDVDTVNELLDIENHPVYTVLLNDNYYFCNVGRINRINSEYMVETTYVQLYSQFGGRYYPMIHAKHIATLRDTIVPFHKFSLFFPEESYGKELFDEALNFVLSDIYPEFKSKLKGYDFEYIHNTAKYWHDMNNILNAVYTKGIDEEMKKDINENLEKFYEEHPKKPDSTDFEEIQTFRKKLPIKNKNKN